MHLIGPFISVHKTLTTLHTVLKRHKRLVFIFIHHQLSLPARPERSHRFSASDIVICHLHHENLSDPNSTRTYSVPRTYCCRSYLLYRSSQSLAIYPSVLRVNFISVAERNGAAVACRGMMSCLGVRQHH